MQNAGTKAPILRERAKKSGVPDFANSYYAAPRNIAIASPGGGRGVIFRSYVLLRSGWGPLVRVSHCVVVGR